ncbi:hypothetical protein [Candidatus Pandoraea novymonadis]|uniref:Uncharacterized protein n=1 Tax=Candidatus Pandoraea novymonadis TaxID=1808959 RepID=A0ABX5FFH0_9BURK|nr:hypothetical protein [Candidatus Pandoraea novymonadis]PSB91787.1 hypothetical protein BZL35_00830 [Candidatus Pandoraea novymonadis]
MAVPIKKFPILTKVSRRDMRRLNWFMNFSVLCDRKSCFCPLRDSVFAKKSSGIWKLRRNAVSKLAAK